MSRRETFGERRISSVKVDTLAVGSFPIVVAPGATGIAVINVTVPNDEEWEVLYASASLLHDSFADMVVGQAQANVASKGFGVSTFVAVASQTLFFSPTFVQVIYVPTIGWTDIGAGFTLGYSMNIMNSGIVNHSIFAGDASVHIRRTRLGPGG